MKNKTYKFTILDRMRKLPYEDYQIAFRFLPEKLRITKATFKNWLYIKSDDSAEIPASAIIVLSTFFECEAKEIFTNQMDSDTFFLEWENEKLANRSEKQKLIDFYESRY